MADAVWPISLPLPLVTGLRGRLPALTRRTQMDAGPAKVRRVLSHNVELVDVSIRVTGEQLDTFIAFYADTILGGALPFEWKNHRNGGACEYRLIGEPDWTPTAPRDGEQGEYWTVNFQLELMPAVVTATAEVVGESEGPRSNFGWGFGTLDRGGIDGGFDLDGTGGAFEHSMVPGSFDQGQPGGPGSSLPPGSDPCGGGGGSEEHSMSSSGCG